MLPEERQSADPQRPALCPITVSKAKFKIVIMAAPHDSNSSAYVEELKAEGVTDVVRVCESTYSPRLFEEEGIKVHEMSFPDGAAPPGEVIEKWNSLLRLRYKSKVPDEIGVVAVHCVAGLGRAPAMAAVALIEMTNMDYMDAIEKIRERKKGAINVRQLEFLRAYKRTTEAGACCCVM